MTPIDIITTLVAMVVVLYGVLLMTRRQDKDEMKARIKDLMHHRNLLLDKHSTKNIYRQVRMEKKSFWSELILKMQVQGDEKMHALQTHLARAGWMSPNAVYVYGIVKLSATLGGVIVGAIYAFGFTEWSLILKVCAPLAMALIGSYLVEFVVDKAREKRRQRISSDFPEALDLMVICTEAGLSLGMTVQRVAKEIGPLSPELAYEFGLLSIEMNILPDIRTALENFAERLDSPIYQAMVSTLIQSEQYGTPIAQTMRTIADEFRSERLMQAEERAGKVPVLITLPMILFIFPTLFVIILGPAAINISNAF